MCIIFKVHFSMLYFISAKNFTVFEDIACDISSGFSVITGETGAGKSTLLKIIQILLGERVSKDMIRHGCTHATIEMAVSIESNHSLQEKCTKYNIPLEDNLIIRRLFYQDKAGKIFINDALVTRQTLIDIGQDCIEICGQFEGKEFFSPKNCRAMLDIFIDEKTEKEKTNSAYDEYKSFEKQLVEKKESLRQALREQDYIRHVLEELENLSPQKGEEDILAEKRARYMAVEKNMSMLKGLEDQLNHPLIEEVFLNGSKALYAIEKDFPEDIPDITKSLHIALDAYQDATHKLSLLNQKLDYDPHQLSDTEERLFALRAAARKHNVSCDDLADLYQEFQDKMITIDDGEASLNRLEKQKKISFEKYLKHAHNLSKQRLEIVPLFSKKVQQHFEDLHLSMLHFSIGINEYEPHRDGIDYVTFNIALGEDHAPNPIHKVASGGELSRIILAIKAVIGEYFEHSCLIFDEIDKGVGGGTAQAVGNKLKELSKYIPQIIVITHSPQVAASGAQHFHVIKTTNKNKDPISIVHTLEGSMRQEEIARMLSGETITQQAREAAMCLLENI